MTGRPLSPHHSRAPPTSAAVNSGRPGVAIGRRVVVAVEKSRCFAEPWWPKRWVESAVKEMGVTTPITRGVHGLMPLRLFVRGETRLDKVVPYSNLQCWILAPARANCAHGVDARTYGRLISASWNWSCTKLSCL